MVFVTVAGIFDEWVGVYCWQRFYVNISDSMFQSISSLKLFALFDQDNAAQNATSFYGL